MLSPRGKYTRPQWASILQTGRTIERSRLALRDYFWKTTYLETPGN